MCQGVANYQLLKRLAGLEGGQVLIVRTVGKGPEGILEMDQALLTKRFQELKTLHILDGQVAPGAAQAISLQGCSSKALLVSTWH